MIKSNIITLAILFTVFIAVSSSSSISTVYQNPPDIQVSGDNETSTINITYPVTGYLHAFGGKIYIDFLEYLGYSLVVHKQLCVKTNTTGNLDYVVFNLTTFPLETSVIESITDYDYPFACCFTEALDTGYNYTITATGYNETRCCYDIVEKVAYIQISEGKP